MRKSFDHISETELLNRYYMKGDIDCLGILLQRYSGVLLGVCLKYINDISTAQDLVQQVFIKALEKLPKDISNFGGWLYIVARNECMDYIRKNKVVENNDIHLISEDVDLDFHELRDKREAELILQLNALKMEQKVVLEYFYLENKSYQEIVEITGWTMNEVKSYIQNGKRNLKLKLEQHHKDQY